jgi:uncharacterized protein with beta-barrel porin domain
LAVGRPALTHESAVGWSAGADGDVADAPRIGTAANDTETATNVTTAATAHR